MMTEQRRQRFYAQVRRVRATTDVLAHQMDELARISPSGAAEIGLHLLVDIANSIRTPDGQRLSRRIAHLLPRNVKHLP